MCEQTRRKLDDRKSKESIQTEETKGVYTYTAIMITYQLQQSLLSFALFFASVLLDLKAIFMRQCTRFTIATATSYFRFC
jgi:hypothetical protein